MNNIRPTINKGGIMADYVLNQKLSDLKLGNYLIKITNIGDKRQSKYCSYEYYVTVTFQITDLNNPKKTHGVIVPGFGPKPIELNTNKEKSLMFFNWQDFDETLFSVLKVYMKWINHEGYYKKEVV